MQLPSEKAANIANPKPKCLFIKGPPLLLIYFTYINNVNIVPGKAAETRQCLFIKLKAFLDNQLHLFFWLNPPQKPIRLIVLFLKAPTTA